MSSGLPPAKLKAIDDQMAEFEREMKAMKDNEPSKPAVAFTPHAVQKRAAPSGSATMSSAPVNYTRRTADGQSGPQIYPSNAPQPPKPPSDPSSVMSNGAVAYTTGTLAAGTSSVHMPCKMPGATITAAPTTNETENPFGFMQSQVLASDVALMEEKRRQDALFHRNLPMAARPVASSSAAQGPLASGATAHVTNHSLASYHYTQSQLAITRAQQPKKRLRMAGGEVWEDANIKEWDENDYRMFAGNLGNEVSDELLAKMFRQYKSFQKAKVVRHKHNNKSKGYGFVSFKDPEDFVKCMKELQGKYVGNRPVILKKSDWKEREYAAARAKGKKVQKLGM